MTIAPSLRHLSALLLLPLSVGTGCTSSDDAPMAPGDGGSSAVAAASIQSRSFPVSGSAVHFFSTAVQHSEEPTPTGQILRTTDIIRLEGDLDGFALYHPTTVIDGAAGTLVNTGTQIFSGTVKGSDPVLLHDNRFRFEVQLATGETRGDVFLGRSKDAPAPGHWFECTLKVTGTGFTPEGDGLADYSGTCVEYGRPGPNRGA